MNECGHLLASDGSRKNIFSEIFPIIPIQTVAQGLPIKDINPHRGEVGTALGHSRSAFHRSQHGRILRFLDKLGDSSFRIRL